MIKTPPLRSSSGNPILALISGVNGRTADDHLIEEGFMEISHFSGDMLVWGRNAPEMYMGWPYLGGICKAPDGSALNSYGVCDSPKQFVDRYKDALAADPVRTFFTTFTHIRKNPSNRGQGGGWRWHKWGPYIGEGTPGCEYLDDEDGFAGGVYVYHVLQVDGPEIAS